MKEHAMDADLRFTQNLIHGLMEEDGFGVDAPAYKRAFVDFCLMLAAHAQGRPWLVK
jgi:hypothetical protein